MKRKKKRDNNEDYLVKDRNTVQKGIQEFEIRGINYFNHCNKEREKIWTLFVDSVYFICRDTL